MSGETPRATIGGVARSGPWARPVRPFRIGFVALTDCAPLVIAKERGYFRRNGVEVSLQREPSWANIRDKLLAGALDAAHALAPMTLATSLGLDGPPVPLVAPMSLGLGGNAITVSRALHARMLEADPDGMARSPGSARPLKAVIDAARTAGAPRLRFAVVFPFSPHHYELCYWMAAAGIDPSRDVEIGVVPPVSVAGSLQRGEIDGYCVGEPWNHFTVEQGLGRSLVGKHEIWSNSPEKVLALTEERAADEPERLRAVLRGLLEASAWIDPPDHRLETAHVIAGESFVDAPVSVVAGSLLGRFRTDRDRVTEVPDFHVFHRYAATTPWVSHAAWFLAQMLRWGQIEKPIDLRAVARRVYRPDLHREACEDVGLPCPDAEEKVEGAHDLPWMLRDAPVPIPMGADRFLDGVRFDPRAILAYLEQLEVTNLRVRLDDLALCNG